MNEIDTQVRPADATEVEQRLLGRALEAYGREDDSAFVEDVPEDELLALGRTLCREMDARQVAPGGPDQRFVVYVRSAFKRMGERVRRARSIIVPPESFTMYTAQHPYNFNPIESVIPRSEQPRYWNLVSFGYLFFRMSKTEQEHDKLPLPTHVLNRTELMRFDFHLDVENSIRDRNTPSFLRSPTRR